MEKIGHLGEQLELWWHWVQQQPLQPLLKSRYAPGRLECYYGLAVDLRQQPTISSALQDGFVTAIGDRFLPHWHSALLCQYKPGVGINPHRDHTCFRALAVIINLGFADFIEYLGRDKIVTHLQDGNIVRIDTKVLHGIPKVRSLRYSLTFRQFKPEYLEQFQSQQLNLLPGLN